MPRGGNRGGGRPKLSPELKKVTVSYCLNHVLAKAIKNESKVRKSKSVSDLVEQILIEYFKSNFKGAIIMANYRIYRLPWGGGFYIVTEGKRAYFFDEETDFEEAAKSCFSAITVPKNVWDEFSRDLSNHGIEGFGFSGAKKNP